MSAPAPVATGRAASGVAKRIDGYDWASVTADLDLAGNAVLERLLSPNECRELARLYASDSGFRSRVIMARHGFGRGEYKYFEYPLPPIIAELRTALYSRLAPLANRWNSAMGIGFAILGSTRSS